MRKAVKYGGIAILSLLACLVLYFSWVTLEARRYTRQVVLTDLKQHQWRPLNAEAETMKIDSRDLTERQREILIRVQDPGFYGHHGIDLRTPGAGLTTITQAIVKKLYFDKFTPGFAKLKQSVIARFAADPLLPKAAQLTLFLNMAYFGRVGDNPVTGLADASDAYYHKPVSALSEDEYISLIAMLVMPGTFHLLTHPEWNRDRVARIRALLDGRYVPTGLMDQFYGDLPKAVQDTGLPPASYFGKRE